MSEVLSPRRPELALKASPSTSWLSGLWRRELPRHPDTGPHSRLPFIFDMAGRWSPAKARQDAHAHQQAVQRDMQTLGIA